MEEEELSKPAVLSFIGNIVELAVEENFFGFGGRGGGSCVSVLPSCRGG